MEDRPQRGDPLRAGWNRWHPDAWRFRLHLRGVDGIQAQANRVDFVSAWPATSRLERAIIPELVTATIEGIRTSRTALRWDFSYTTLGKLEPGAPADRGKAEATGVRG